MDFLKQSILKKKEELQQKKGLVLTNSTNKQQQQQHEDGERPPTASNTSSVVVPAEQPKKYLKRRELAEVEQKVEEQLKKKKTDDHHSGSKNDTDSDATADTHGSDSEAEASTKRSSIPVKEVMRRLRAMGLPITLFGETEADRFERLKSAEVNFHERQQSHIGSSNAFQMIEQDVEKEIINATIDAMEDAKDKEKALQKKKKVSKYSTMRPKSSFEAREDYCLFFIKHVLQLWENDLNARPEAEKKSKLGQRAAATQKQTRHNLKPLMDLLKQKSVTEDVMNYVELVVDCCLAKDYIKANEHYLMLAIGDAPWPIGVTMVGIHERSGREKIFAQKVAHVLNDEIQRKYIQGIKRIMTYHEKKRIDE